MSPARWALNFGGISASLRGASNGPPGENFPVVTILKMLSVGLDREFTVGNLDVPLKNNTSNVLLRLTVIKIEVFTNQYS